MGAYARHIKGGRLAEYAAQANRRAEEKVREGLICCACGRAFSDAVRRSETDRTLCEECRAAVDF